MTPAAHYTYSPHSDLLRIYMAAAHQTSHDLVHTVTSKAETPVYRAFQHCKPRIQQLAKEGE